MLAGASEAVVDADHELALIAAICGVPVRCVGEGMFNNLGQSTLNALHDAVRVTCLDGVRYLNPFTGTGTAVEDAIAVCSFWRHLIDGNREIAAAFGFAQWKRSAVAPLLWSGSKVRFRARATSLRPGERVAVWRSRISDGTLSELAAKQAHLIEVEDGFVRSAGLGADCIPPLSIVVDPLGVHFNPAKPSQLEVLLEEGEFSEDVVARARRLRELIVSSGVSKYGAQRSSASRSVDGLRHLLVTGQVEDDRSVLEGGGEVKNNLTLLQRARAAAPNAHILYKPHPDVEAGHRIGAIPDKTVLAIADEIVRNDGISDLIDMVDEVHVNTSLAGFEALMRGKAVTTHGVPFYAGWGLTRDLGPVPDRRTRRRTLDELVAAVLLIYPRYLDPETGLPCPPEILIQRLSQTSSHRKGSIVHLRRLQGRLKRLLATFRWR
ncbi:MAG: hypothetical protein ABIO43_03630 [Sphingomicrobium sp.]